MSLGESLVFIFCTPVGWFGIGVTGFVIALVIGEIKGPKEYAPIHKEKETRIKYQDIVYKVCNLVDGYCPRDGGGMVTVDEVVAVLQKHLEECKELRFNNRT